MTHHRSVALSFVIHVITYYCCWAGDTTSSSILDDLFPAHNEDYDANVLDPLHGYGSPYGGFSRATRRRLAALPLTLPDLTVQDGESDDPWDPMYTTFRDGSTGQWYACRVYHQDEVMPQSMVDSMYAPPVFRNKDSHVHEYQDENGVSLKEVEPSDKEESSPPSSSTDEGMKTEDGETLRRQQDEVDSSSGTKSEWDGGPIVNLNDAIRIAKITTRLDSLKGQCGQIHKGWWSYEWCNQNTMAQFHVAIKEGGDSVELQDITYLGDFVERRWEFQFKENPPNPLARGRHEAARVTDVHEGGAICPDTGKPRQSLVHIICCSDEIIARKKKLIRKGDTALANGDFAVFDVVEDKEQVCHYNVTICTPLLCDTGKSSKDADAVEGDSSIKEADEETTRRAYKENESVMEILDRTLGGPKPVCLQSITGGWWTFEFCHGKSIRQYHEVVGTKRDKNGVPQTTRVIETDHNLGRPQSHVFRAILPEDEWKFVVNATDKKGGKKPYFELEYTNGDICDDHDVRDAAIVAGNTGARGLARASSVRYSCGERYDIAVNEDSTCHYVVNIVVPDLCRHPLFKTPVSKKQVFKCLPIDEPDVSAESILG